MDNLSTVDREFLDRLSGLVKENMASEQFGVAELSRLAGMSRSNLLRKLKKLTGLSVSLYIRRIRLEEARELLRDSSLNVSEVSYQVGFGSTSYFIRCFREQYGVSPGEAVKNEPDPVSQNPESSRPSGRKKRILLISMAGLIIVTLVLLFFRYLPSKRARQVPERSIAVLPFRNDSNDSTNTYLVNGLMEAILDHLQKIGDLRVVSRTSAEKYRNSSLTVPEIARELDVAYVLEGSGQKAGDRILLHIQLIEAEKDRHLWSEHFERETLDVFKLQMEIAKRIAHEIEVVVTPEEEQRIEKIPTENIVAYDYFLRGLEELNSGMLEGLSESIPLFERALELDPSFARACAALTIAYYYLDLFVVEKQHGGLIQEYSERAMKLDPELSQSHVARALSQMHGGNYEEAAAHLEIAHEFSPGWPLVINLLADIYTSNIPDTEKYLQFALKGLGLDPASSDSSELSFVYLHISNAFMQTGFTAEALNYIDQSLEYDHGNLYSEYVRAYILYARDRSLSQTRDLLKTTYQKDSSRWDVLQELAKIHYYLRDFKSAGELYSRFLEMTRGQQMSVYPSEDMKIARVMLETGNEVQAAQLMKEYHDFAEANQSLYRGVMLAQYYAQSGELEKAISSLKDFLEEDNYHYWTVLFLEMDPLMDSLRENPEFGTIISALKLKFWENHKRIRSGLEEKGLI